MVLERLEIPIRSQSDCYLQFKLINITPTNIEYVGGSMIITTN